MIERNLAPDAAAADLRSATAHGDPLTRGWRAVFVGIIVGAVLFAYWPALHGEFLWDDELDITGNTALRDASGLWRIWFSPVGLYDYYPIKYTVQWLQWQLWSTSTFGYHVTNVALHACSALLFWRVLGRLGVRRGWLGGLLFAVHPLAVESVAWITELKNTLSLPFLLLALDRWLAFDAGRRRDYVAAVLLFLGALLCKTSVVMFPVTLLLLAWWQRGRIGLRDLRNTAPLFALSLLFGLITLWFQQHRAIGPADVSFEPIGGLLARVACAGSSLAFYVSKTLLPVGLVPIYPQWPVNPPAPHLFLPWLALAATVGWSWRHRATWGRHALLGVGWFVVHLLPVLGFVPISSQRFTWVMDHLAYVPLLGLVGLATAGAGVLFERLPAARRPLALGAASVVVGALAWQAHVHARVFRSEEALWQHTVEHNPAAWMAHYNLGTFAGRAGRADAAVAHYRRAIAARPNYPEAWNNLGNELRNAGQPADAIAAYEEALRLKPSHYSAHNNLGAALAAAGRVPEAIERCNEALRLNPRFAPAHRNLGNILAGAGRTAEAITHLERALALQPAFSEAENDLGVALANAGRVQDALAHYERALRLKPEYAEAHNNLGSTLRDLGRSADAVPHFQAALKSRPGYANAHYNLGGALLDLGRMEEAAGEFEATLRLRPDNAEAHFSLGNVRAMAGDATTALTHYDHAVRLNPSFAEAHRNAGILLTQAGRTADAVKRFQQAVQAKPDFADAHLSLAMAHQALGNVAEAIAAYENARKLRPELPPLDR